jgi:hypothetical protein
MWFSAPQLYSVRPIDVPGYAVFTQFFRRGMSWTLSLIQLWST